MSAQMIQRRTFLAGLSGLVLVASVSREIGIPVEVVVARGEQLAAAAAQAVRQSRQRMHLQNRCGRQKASAM